MLFFPQATTYTLCGGQDVLTRKFNNTHSTLYEGKGRRKQVLPPMPTGRYCPAVISHDNLLLVTGGVAEDESTVLNTTNVLDLTTMKWSTPEGLNLPVPLWGHHLALCGEYLYLVGGTTEYPWKSPEDDNSQAWRAKWSDVKQTAAPQHFQPQRGVWTQIVEPPTLCPTLVKGHSMQLVDPQEMTHPSVRCISTSLPETSGFL